MKIRFCLAAGEILLMKTPSHNAGSEGYSASASNRKSMLITLVAGAASLVPLIAYGIHSRVHAEATLAHATEENAVLRVRTIQPKLGSPSEELVLPGNTEAFTDTPIYARTNGYLKRWYVDIGAHVKAGQLLAEIETPEVDQQLRQARAQLATAEADSRLSKSTAERWKNLRKTDAVSPQETEEKVGDMESKNAMEDAARANVRRLEQTQSFQKIYAPFSGIITARNVDIGDLISAGSSGTAKELFHLAAVGQIRVYIQVPQLNARSAMPGTPVELALPEMPGQLIAAHVARTSNAMDPASRTLRVEIDVDNAKEQLVPGEYVQVHIKLASPSNTLIVPVNGVLFRSEGISAVVVHGDHVELQPITIGRDFGDELEVTSGLSQNERIVINPPDSIVSGQKIQLAQAGAQ
jgi:RND family efflux transporter MFP subunit